jgi:transcriptional regulator with XRE-family HTH domain
MLLRTILRSLRLRICRYATTLGPHRRPPSRQGQPVTQEELAEYLGVSRVWYAALESSIEARPSLALLERLAETLMLTAEERTALFDAAIPELRLADLRDERLAS